MWCSPLEFKVDACRYRDTAAGDTAVSCVVCVSLRRLFNDLRYRVPIFAANDHLLDLQLVSTPL
jgi:hypothetical protein